MSDKVEGMARNAKWYPRKTTEEERFWAKVDKTETCWLWTAGKDRRGYGKFKSQGKTVRAHRYSYMLVNGSIPNGLFVCHECDVPGCVNPQHLWLGPPSSNTRDMVLKNRHGAHMKPGTHCRNGHEYAVVGTFIHKGKREKRQCKECRRNAEKRRRSTPEKLDAYRKYQREYKKRTKNLKKQTSVGGQTDKATDF